jgi:rubrerythrin
MVRAIQGVEEFYAHALAIEREAAERYAEFETWFHDRGEEVLAGLCRTLAEMEGAHFLQLARACNGLKLPAIAADDYRWLEAGAPESVAREAFYRIATPRQLLEIALHAECNALAFFEWVVRSAGSEPVRALAREMAAEEMQHVRWVQQALEYGPSSHLDWEKLLARGIRPGAFTGEARPARKARKVAQ